MADDGPEAFTGFVRWLRGENPNLHLDIKRVFADGDYVITHFHLVLEPGGPGQALADIFRLENGKVVEHWNVIQAVPRDVRQLQRHVLTLLYRHPKRKPKLRLDLWSNPRRDPAASQRDRLGTQQQPALPLVKLWWRPDRSARGRSAGEASGGIAGVTSAVR